MAKLMATLYGDDMAREYEAVWGGPVGLGHNPQDAIRAAADESGYLTGAIVFIPRADGWRMDDLAELIPYRLVVRIAGQWMEADQEEADARDADWEAVRRHAAGAARPARAVAS